MAVGETLASTQYGYHHGTKGSDVLPIFSLGEGAPPRSNNPHYRITENDCISSPTEIFKLNAQNNFIKSQPYKNKLCKSN